MKEALPTLPDGYHWVVRRQAPTHHLVIQVVDREGYVWGGAVINPGEDPMMSANSALANALPRIMADRLDPRDLPITGYLYEGREY